MTCPRLAGIAEIAALLGVSRQRASEIAHTSPAFPAPLERLAMGPVYDAAAVERFLAGWLRARGRPRKKAQTATGAVIAGAIIEIPTVELAGPAAPYGSL